MRDQLTAVVTGATSGIGLAAARRLAAEGVRIVGVARNGDKAARARAAVLEETPGADVTFVAGDLSTTDAVRGIAREIARLLDGDALDILILAAGAVSSWRIDTQEGYELQFAVNHLAPFLLTRSLLPALEKAPEARVLIVSSGSHRRTRIRWGDVMMRRRYSCLSAYKQSKLCNVLFGAELARRLCGTFVSVYVVDPGLVNTQIGLKNTRGLERFVWERRSRGGAAPEAPAGYMAALATQAQYAGKTGLYWRRGVPKKPSRAARDVRQAGRLWALSEKLCGLSD